MLIQGIPSKQIVEKIARNNKDYEADFANTDTNSDVYGVKVFLRHFNRSDNKKDYKVRMVLISSVLAYPALDLSWSFKDDEYELASRVFHRICNEIDDIKSDFDRSMMPASIVSAQLREAIRPISQSHQEKTNILSLDESARIDGESDWRNSIYSGRYPNMTKEERQKQQKIKQQTEEQPKRITYPSRRKKNVDR